MKLISNFKLVSLINFQTWLLKSGLCFPCSLCCLLSSGGNKTHPGSSSVWYVSLTQFKRIFFPFFIAVLLHNAILRCNNAQNKSLSQLILLHAMHPGKTTYLNPILHGGGQKMPALTSNLSYLKSIQAIIAKLYDFT